MKLIYSIFFFSTMLLLSCNKGNSMPITPSNTTKTQTETEIIKCDKAGVCFKRPKGFKISPVQSGKHILVKLENDKGEYITFAQWEYGIPEEYDIWDEEIYTNACDMFMSTAKNPYIERTQISFSNKTFKAIKVSTTFEENDHKSGVQLAIKVWIFQYLYKGNLQQFIFSGNIKGSEVNIKDVQSFFNNVSFE